MARRSRRPYVPPALTPAIRIDGSGDDPQLRLFGELPGEPGFGLNHYWSSASRDYRRALRAWRRIRRD